MLKINKKIYLDCASTTPVDKEVLKVMMPYFFDKFGNASSVHSFGQEAMAAIDQSREKIAKLLNCKFEEIIFTGSATEANNLAINGLVKYLSENKYGLISANKRMPFHIISTTIEHESIHEPLRQLKEAGHEMTYLKVNKDGLISIFDLEKSIKNNTLLVSVIYANNEIGTIQLIKEIGRLLEKINQKRRENNLSRIYFHTDAVQAFQFLECRPDWLKADLLTFSGHKIYGSKGIGALYVRKNTPIYPIITGGGQEFGLRSGTENIANIVGLAKAVELSYKNRETRFKKMLNLRNKLLKSIMKYNRDVKINGSISFSNLLGENNRLPNNLNIRFPGVSSETLIIALDQSGLAISAGSACSSRAMAASHVLTAIGLTDKKAKESVRITLGKDTTEDEIKKTIAIINQTVKKLKAI